MNIFKEKVDALRAYIASTLQKLPWKNKNKNDEERVEIKKEYQTVHEHYSDLLKPLEQRQKIKHYILIGIIVFGIIGGLRSYFPAHADMEALAVSETQTFVKTYAANYFTYPNTETLDAYFKSYSLDTKWRISYDTLKVDNASASNIEIYKVNPDQDDTRYADYYLYLTQSLKLKDGSSRQTVYNVKVRLFHDDGYLVSEPLSMRTLEVPDVVEDIKKELALSPSSGSEQIIEDEKKELANTISLFLNTYSENYEQAQLLTDLPQKLDALDPNTKLVLDGIISGTKSSNSFFVEASINEVLDEAITNKKNMHFEIDIKTNKIIEIKEM